MQIRNNRDELIGEINTGLTRDGDRFTTHTSYDQHGNVTVQNISIRDNRGKVFTTTVFGAKVLP